MGRSAASSDRLSPRRALAGLAWLAAAAAITLTACGGGGGEDTGGAGDGTITIAVRGHFVPQMEQITELYRADHPDVTFEIQTLPDEGPAIVQRLSTARLGDETPDIIENIDILADQLATNDVTADLREYFDQDAGLTADDFIPAFLDAYRPAGAEDEIHGMPVSADATVLYYNKTLFDQVGEPYPTDSWTWEDMSAAAQRITTAGEGQFYGMVQGDPWQAIYNPLIELYGGHTYDSETNTVGIGSPEAVQAWEKILGLFLDGANAPYEIGSQLSSAPKFESGSVGMFINVRAQIPILNAQMTQDWGVAPMPTVEDERPIGGGSYGLALTSASREAEAAWDFLVWFYQVDGGQPVLQETYQSVPPTTEGLEQGIWRDLPAPPENPEVYAEAAEAAVMAPKLPQRGEAALTEAIKTATQEVVLEGRPIADAFADAETAVNDALGG